MSTTEGKSELIHRVILKYARMNSNGRRPQRCEKPARGDRWGSVGKIIYPDRDTARRAAQEMFQLTGERLYAYGCPRSRHGHHHLTSRK